jgi:hypothetical protein
MNLEGNGYMMNLEFITINNNEQIRNNLQIICKINVL